MTPRQENWLALALVQGLGYRLARQMSDALGGVERIFQTSPEALCRQFGMSLALANAILQAPRALIFAREKAAVMEAGVEVVSVDDPAYPARMLDTALPPNMLFVAGESPLPEGPALGVVGTRRCTRYGENVTRRLVEEMAGQLPNAVVVSGLARGIDTVAHQHALECGLKTVGVMANGLGMVYPSENTELAQRMKGQGALVTEFCMDVQPLGRQFPMRNRIISGLCDALLVVEAGERSGALITAGFAQNHGRPVFAVPGSLEEASFAGTNRLIQTGQAQLVTTGAQLAEAMRTGIKPAATQLDLLAPAVRKDNGGKRNPRGGGGVHQGDKGKIMDCLARGPMHPNDLAAEVDLPIEKMSGMLLELELSGDIYQTADNLFAQNG